MATTTVVYNPASGRQVVTLTSWAGDATFTTTPVATNQIEGPDSITINVDGTMSGTDGVYDLRHVVASTGSNEYASYTLGNPDLTAPILSSLVVTGNSYHTLDVSVDTDEDNGTLYLYASANASETAATVKSSGQVSQAVSALGTQSASISDLTPGTYYLHAMHEDAATNPSAVASSTAVTLTQSVSTTIAYTAGASRTAVTLEDPIDPFMFEGWAALPEAGEQLATQTSAGTFDKNGNFTTDVEAIIPVHHTAADGTVTRFTIDSSGLDAGADTQPDDFSFTALTSQALSAPGVESNAVIITGVDAGEDVPVSISGDASSEYAVSTDGGNTWGGWTSAATSVRLNYQIKVRHDTSNEYSSGGHNGVRISTLNVGGVLRNFQTTTIADTTNPVITLTGGNVQVDQGSVWTEPGYSATDNADGDLTGSVVVTGTVDTAVLGPVTLTYSVTDASGNSASTTRTVTVVEVGQSDTTAPVISLVGGNQTLTEGDVWSEPGYTATDDVDGDITANVAVTGTVNTAVPGTYTRTYSVSDAAGNSASTTRTVTVQPAVAYPVGDAAPASRTYTITETYRPEQAGKVFFINSGATLDYDFDLTAWLAAENDSIVAGQFSTTEASDSLQIESTERVTGLDRIKVWLTAGAGNSGESYPVQLTLTTNGARTAVFQFRIIVIDQFTNG